jgi:aminoglycoside phosphotransferase (APT) family kinase protein
MARILSPLAYWPDLRMLIQPAVVGMELNTLAFADAEDLTRREQWLRAAGRSLAALHGSAGTAAPQRTWGDDLVELEEYDAPLAQVVPPLAARFREARDALAAAAADHAEPAPVASHGTFRTDQLLIEDSGLVMIDLDSFCWANPARDIGNFLAYLRWKAIRRPAQDDFIAVAGRAFLAGYAAVRPLPDATWRAFYEAVSLLKIAGRRFRSLTVKEWPLVPDLLAAASATLESSTLR